MLEHFFLCMDYLGFVCEQNPNSISQRKQLFFTNLQHTEVSSQVFSVHFISFRNVIARDTYKHLHV